MATLVLYETQIQARKAARHLMDKGVPAEDILVLTSESLLKALDRMPSWFLFGAIMGGFAGVVAGTVIGYFAPIAFGFEKYIGGFPYPSLIFGGMNGFIAGTLMGGYNGLLGGLWAGKSLEKTIREMGEGHAMLQVRSVAEQDPLICSMAAEFGGSCLVHEAKGVPTSDNLWWVVSVTLFMILGISLLVGVMLFLESLLFRLHP